MLRPLDLGVTELPLLQLSKFEVEDNKREDASFGDIFWKFWQEVDALQKEAERKSLEVAIGNAESIHEVVIAIEKATLALQLLTQFQNKLVDAYHEIMRMTI
ncbi:MAG: Flagellar hook-basal body complex protein FliE [Thermoanaerobacterales bacterium 50_218]|nr:MAG: Flagellar hook-basal body complex protein FliE [Thermoanaerobacterales bacterium 50_218]HAA90235.1 flagellar hook-basal body complex protein FliE [Peptococcaceae bacterium]